MSVYIFTMPKAGTYFLAELLEQIGLRNTGYHINKTSYLDTKKFSLQQNMETPAIALVDTFFASVVWGLAPDEVAFGHFPVPLNPGVVPDHMKYLCAYRHPQKTLVSEFIDFRFRRSDIPWLSRQEIPDDREAFVVYLEQHGLWGQLNVFKNLVYYHMIAHHSLLPENQKNRAYFVNFQTVLQDAGIVRDIAAFVGRPVSEQGAENIHAAALSAETKTKTVGLDIDRDALWSDQAHSLYDMSELAPLVEIARRQGMDL